MEIYVKPPLTLQEKKENQEDVILLSKVSFQKTSQNKDKPINPTKSDSLEQKNRQLEEENIQVKIKVIRIEGFLKFINFAEYKVKSANGERSTSNVNLVFCNEEYIEKEPKDTDHKNIQRFLSECEVMLILRHPCVLCIIVVYNDHLNCFPFLHTIQFSRCYSIFSFIYFIYINFCVYI